MLIVHNGHNFPTHCKVGSKPHPAPRGFLNMVGPTGSNSCRSARRYILFYLFGHNLSSPIVDYEIDAMVSMKKEKPTMLLSNTI